MAKAQPLTITARANYSTSNKVTIEDINNQLDKLSPAILFKKGDAETQDVDQTQNKTHTETYLSQQDNKIENVVKEASQSSICYTQDDKVRLEKELLAFNGRRSLSYAVLVTCPFYELSRDYFNDRISARAETASGHQVRT